jgi:hypothetical protein
MNRFMEQAKSLRVPDLADWSDHDWRPRWVSCSPILHRVVTQSQLHGVGGSGWPGVFAGFGYAYLVLVKETMLKRVHNYRFGFASPISWKLTRLSSKLEC